MTEHDANLIHELEDAGMHDQAHALYATSHAVHRVPDEIHVPLETDVYMFAEADSASDATYARVYSRYERKGEH